MSTLLLTSSSCFQLFRSYDHLIRPLCSSTITAPSSLLLVGPPQCSASVLSPRGFRRLRFSLDIRALVPAVPRESQHPVHAPFTPVAVCPVIRHPTDLSQKRFAPLVLTTSGSFRRVIEGFTFVRLPDTHLLEVMPRAFAPTLTTTAFDRSRLEWFGTWDLLL